VGSLCRAGARPGGRGLSRLELAHLADTAAEKSWQLSAISGRAVELVGDTAAARAEGKGAGSRRTCRLCEVTDRAVVLGSTQAASDVDPTRCERLGATVVRRRSGGGAVFVAPQAQVWADVFVPAGDPLWHNDVGKSFLWLGDVWASAIRAVVPGVVAVGQPGGEATSWSGRLCFGGLGAGEVALGGRKVVGVSQRRDRTGAWLHSMVLLQDTSDELAACLALDEPDRSRALCWLREHSGTVPTDAQALVEAVVTALP
jgi:lipoate-protein ligase A